MDATRKGIAKRLNEAAGRGLGRNGDYFAAVTGGDGRILISAFLSPAERPIFAQFVRRSLGPVQGGACEIARTREMGNIVTRHLSDVRYVVYDANRPFSRVGTMEGLADTEAHAQALVEWMAGAGKKMRYRPVQ